MDQQIQKKIELWRWDKIQCLELSARELYIARLISWGYSVKEVAAKLFLSPATVIKHTENIYRKLDIHSQADLTRWYIFKEYGIADNPMKKVLAVFLLMLTVSSVLMGSANVRTFRVQNTSRACRVVRSSRARRDTYNMAPAMFCLS
jgi:DNA-binding CsgD family transcriptional regulator